MDRPPNIDGGRSKAFRVSLVVCAIVAIVSLLDNTLVHYLGADMSWLLTAADGMIGGQRLYVDIWETNPPFSVLLYLPAAYAEHLLGLRAEFVGGLYSTRGPRAVLGMPATCQSDVICIWSVRSYLQ